jgi:hypothetical protein
VDLASLVRKQGFAILNEVLLPTEAERLVADLQTSSLRRSKAGIRHALKHPAVAALAVEPRLMEIARQVLGYRRDAFPRNPLRQVTTIKLARRVASRHGAPPARTSRHTGVGAVVHKRRSDLRPRSSECPLPSGGASPSSRRLHAAERAAAGLTWNTRKRRTERRCYSRTRAADCARRLFSIARRSVGERPLTIHASSKSTFQMPRRVLHIEYAESAAIEAGLDLAVA